MPLYPILTGVVKVRPYLIDDGGDVEVVKVEDGVVSLKLQVSCVLDKELDFLFCLPMPVT